MPYVYATTVIFLTYMFLLPVGYYLMKRQLPVRQRCRSLTYSAYAMLFALLAWPIAIIIAAGFDAKGWMFITSQARLTPTNKRTFNTLLMSAPLMPAISHAVTRSTTIYWLPKRRGIKLPSSIWDMDSYATDPNSALVQYMTHANHDKPKLLLLPQPNWRYITLPKQSIGSCCHWRWVGKMGRNPYKQGNVMRVGYLAKSFATIEFWCYYYASDLISVYVLYRLYQVTRY